MSSTATPTRGRRGRRAPQEGPRASLKQLLPFLLEHRRVLVIVVILSIFGAIATLAQPLLVGLLINRVQAGEPLGMLVWGVFALVVAASVISGFQHFLLQRTGTAVVYSSRRKLIGRILHLPISEFDARRTGDLVSRVGTDTTLLYAVLTQGLADAVGNSLVFVGALVAMALIDPALLGLIVLVIGLSIGGVTLLSGRIRTATRDQQEKVGELASGVERSVGSIRTVRAAGASDREEAAISRLAEEAYDQGVRIAKVSALIVPIAGIALQLSLLVVLGVGGLRVASGAITVAALVTFIMFLFLLIAPLGSTFGAITSVNQALGALGRIQEILDLPTETQGDAALARRVRDADDRRAGSPGAAIEFRDVHFRYPDAVVAARRTAESEALARPRERAPRRLLHVGGRGPRTHPRRRRGAARSVLLGAARFSRGTGRAVGRRKEHDPRPHRTLLRPDGRRRADRRRRRAHPRPRRAARAPRLRRAGRPDPRRDHRREPATGLARGIR